MAKSNQKNKLAGYLVIVAFVFLFSYTLISGHLANGGKHYVLSNEQVLKHEIFKLCSHSLIFEVNEGRTYRSQSFQKIELRCKPKGTDSYSTTLTIFSEYDMDFSKLYSPKLIKVLFLNFTDNPSLILSNKQRNMMSPDEYNEALLHLLDSAIDDVKSGVDKRIEQANNREAWSGS